MGEVCNKSIIYLLNLQSENVKNKNGIKNLEV
jgi:hypothetical protein